MTCQFVGDVQRTHNRPCFFRARFAVAVNGLSPLCVCVEHVQTMQRMWQPTIHEFALRRIVDAKDAA